MLLKTGQHSKVTFIQDRAAVPLNVARAGALFLLSTTVLRKSGV
jgi:hypothetical protein